MSFDLFVIPFFGGLIFLIIILIIKYGRWIREMPGNERLKLAFGLFKKNFWKASFEVFMESLLHRRMFRQNKLMGYMHMSFAFGWFMLIVIGNLESRIYSGGHINPPYYPIFLKFFVQDKRVLPFELDPMPGIFRFAMDFFLLLILSGLVLALFKRVHSNWFGMKRTTKHHRLDKIAIGSLWLIFPMRLLAEGLTAGIYHGGGFLTNTAGNIFATFLPIESLYYPAWWAYSIMLGAFFVSMPWSRFMHIPTEIMLIYCRQCGVKVQKTLGGITEFEIRSCPRCGLCIDVCQMNEVDKTFSTPAYFVQALRENKHDLALYNNCLLCGRCHEVCPVKIDTLGLRVAARNLLYNDLKGSFAYLPVTSPDQKPVDVLYFAGCMGHLTPAVKDAMLKIFEVAGLRYRFMDKDGSVCCGRPMMMAGMQEAATAMIQSNRDAIIQSQAKTFVTSCPICYKVFKEDYDLAGIEVVHHTQFIEKLTAYRMINLKPSRIKAVYHDPCELGRGMGVYEEPRQVLRQMTELLETSNERQDSLCCGGSLGDFTLSLKQRNVIRDNALELMLKPNPDILVTACPLCKKTFASGNRVEVKDIAEIVADALVDKNMQLVADNCDSH
ncbi:MAG: (Fe-S)-binding protein [Bacteroidales bacterium]|nr:(Fe-S)-binding protein [Bacteroidales bacterium]